MVLTGPDGQAWQDSGTDVQGDTVRQPLRSPTEDGQYVVAYRVVSADGHPTSGELTFTVTLRATPAASTAAPPPVATSSAGESEVAAAPTRTVDVDPAATEDDAGSGALPLVIGLVIAVVVLGGAAAFLARRRPAGPG